MGVEVVERNGSMRVLRVCVLAIAAFFVCGFGAAKADAAVFCVAASDPESIDPSCTPGAGKNTVQEAFLAAGDGEQLGPDTIIIGPGTFVGTPVAPLTYFDGQVPGNSLEIVGSGPGGASAGGTTLTISDPTGFKPVLNLTGEANTLTVRDLEIALPEPEGDTDGDRGLDASGVRAENIRITGPSGEWGTGIYAEGDVELIDSSISLLTTPESFTLGINVTGTGTAARVSDSSIFAGVGIASSGAGQEVIVERSRLTPAKATSSPVVSVLKGDVTLNSSLIDLSDKGQVALMAGVAGVGGEPDTGSIEVNGSTIVGSRDFAKGVVTRADAGDSVSATLDSTLIHLTGNGPTALEAKAFQGGSASVSGGYNNFQSSTVFVEEDEEGWGSSATITATSLDAAPGFVGSGDDPYALSASSALIDAGNPNSPALPGPLRDLLDNPRGLDSTGDASGGCVSRRDIGAYEYLPPAPTASITSGPAEASMTADSTPTFGFASSRDCLPVEFACSVDGADPAPCSPPYTLATLAQGTHTLSVRALGEASDPGPSVTRTFTVDTIPPSVTVSGKSKFKARRGKAKVSFSFGSNEPGASFRCRVGTGAYKACAKSFKRTLRPGRYALYAKARDAAGNEGPAKLKRFRVVK